jgi:predicted transcriptional regulator of viral defense system
LGLLLETVPLEGGRDVAREIGRGARYRTPVLLDPSLPASGEVDRRWGVRLNVELAEIEGAGQT